MDKFSDMTAYEMAVRFQQRSAEIHALQIQAYNVAKQRLKHFLQQNEGSKQPAIVIDLDETVLNNIPLVAMGLTQGFDFTEWGEKWEEWVNAAEAELIPGSKEFLDYANYNNVTIFYVSNRLQKNLELTIENLNKLNLPQVSSNNVLLLGDMGTKKERRQKIRKDFEIVMLIGNSLYDLSSEFIQDSVEKQHKIVMKKANHFGDKFIILPNSAYGDYWVDAKLHPWKENKY